MTDETATDDCAGQSVHLDAFRYFTVMCQPQTPLAITVRRFSDNDFYVAKLDGGSTSMAPIAGILATVERWRVQRNIRNPT